MAEILTPDLCVIGAGAGGLAATEAACALGASVVLVERGRLGGDMLNTGTVPARALAAAGAHAHGVRHGAAFGVTADEPRIAFRRTYEHVQQVIAGLSPAVTTAHLEALGAQCIAAEARFVDARTLAAGDVLVRARRFIIATGARPVVPSIPGLDAVPYFTSETIFDNTRKLTHLLIAGGDATGLELAQAYNRLGTQVTVVQPGPPLPGADPELAEIVLARLREEGVDIRTGASVAAIRARSQGIGVVIGEGDNQTTLDVSHILVAGGRLPDLDALDLDKAGISRAKDDPRRLQLSAALKTSNRRVFAIGDAAGGTPSSHLARHQAAMVVRRALLGIPGRIDPAALPRVTYTDPEIAETGLTEAAARARRNDDFRILRWSFADNDRARILRRTHGVAKLITDRSGRLLGAGVVGPGAGELIALFSLAIANRLSARHLQSYLAPHPTLSEVATRLGAEFYRDRPRGPILQRLRALVRLTP